MKILEKISIPKDNVNDDAVQIKKIYVKDNEEVQANTLLMDYETSKANYEIENMNKDDYLYRVFNSINFRRNNRINIII